ncbi:hypothetical protein BW730_04655 [Tessaracoccus aquimaris]|uniref:DUF2975 domain-containing protein n=1 Tax=Tessaracoccus aquimaris TaxID=1332264 RepID=A0A1Q2CLC9_9ACTN|nr:hypothetical protein [Tessaracoccus aquimaris]AQP46916.1 hypothetical protein BW730_04655 [Tessaracoccus aquimaris]
MAAFALVFLVLALLMFGVLAAVLGSAGRANIATVAKVASLIAMGLTGLSALLGAIAALAGGQLDVTVPVHLPIHLADGVTFQDGPSATFVNGVLDQATVQASGLSFATRAVLALAVLLGGATLIGVAWTTWRLAGSMGDSDPFRLGSRALRTTALIVLIGGTAASIASDIGNFLASRELFEVKAWGSTTTGPPVDSLTALGWPEPAGLQVTLPFWPVGAAVVLLLLAAVFRYGALLQADSEGMV